MDLIQIRKRKIKRLIKTLLKFIVVVKYWWFHKILFKVSNTKFDISFCVFEESFLKDQYDIRKFLNDLKKTESLLFFDIGRNHGFIFFYTMYHIMKSGFKVKEITYLGIDPAPLKFVYFNYFSFLRKNGININYYLLDKAVVVENQSWIRLKYGEDNFGNFNVEHSNFAKKKSLIQDRFSYIEIHVETIDIMEIKELIRERMNHDSMIIKIDCKNQTSRIFMETIGLFEDYDGNYLVACEKDDSIFDDFSQYEKSGMNVLTASKIRRN